MLDNLYNRALRKYIYVYLHVIAKNWTHGGTKNHGGPPEWHRVKKNVWKFHMQQQNHDLIPSAGKRQHE